MGASPALAADTRTTPACSDYVAQVEVNTFGEMPTVRTVVIYRGENGEIIDWRWYTTSAMIPRSLLGDGRLIAVWEDQGNIRTIITRSIVYVRSREDRELAERSVLPAEQRRKLSTCPAPRPPAGIVPAAVPGGAPLPPVPPAAEVIPAPMPTP